MVEYIKIGKYSINVELSFFLERSSMHQHILNLQPSCAALGRIVAYITVADRDPKYKTRIALILDLAIGTTRNESAALTTKYGAGIA